MGGILFGEDPRFHCFSGPACGLFFLAFWSFLNPSFYNDVWGVLLVSQNVHVAQGGVFMLIYVDLDSILEGRFGSEAESFFD